MRNPFIKLDLDVKVRIGKFSFNPINWIVIKHSSLKWRDNFGVPRLVASPITVIKIFALEISFRKSLPIELCKYSIGQYYEQYIWWKEYNNKDIKEAENTWAWINFEGKTTWVSDFLKRKSQL